MHAIQMKNFGPPLEVLKLVELPEPSAPAVGRSSRWRRIRADQHERSLPDRRRISDRPTIPSVVGNGVSDAFWLWAGTSGTCGSATAS
jgi:hypothetical protein